MAALLVLFVTLPLLQPGDYLIYLAFRTFLLAVVASAWNLLGGVAGQVSFGGAVFYGIGTYAVGLTMTSGGSPYLGLAIGSVLAVVASVLIGYPCFRLKGPFFAIATLGVGEAVRVVVSNLYGLTGGASGLDFAIHARFFDNLPHYYFALALLVLTLVVCGLVMRSSFGLGLSSLKADEESAEDIGVNSVRLKLYAHALMAALSALAGGVYAHYALYIQPTASFGFGQSISMLLIPVIGGLATLWGPVLGAVVYGVIQDQLLGTYPELAQLIYGGVLVIIVMFEPRGLVGLYTRATQLVRKGMDRWRYSKSAASPSSSQG